MRKTQTFKLVAAVLVVFALAAGIAVAATQLGTPAADAAATRPWSFGVIADTQWTFADDGYNPNTAAANVIRQVDRQFVKAGVKLVVAVGDTVDKGSKVNIDTRALYAQDLYNAGIGFYPLRGNHEANEDASVTAEYAGSGPEFRYAFPQIATGVNNNTPAAITSALIPAADLANNGPVAKRGGTFTVGNSFSQPTEVNAANKSVSYSFQYNNATFVLLDQFDVNGNYTNSTIPQQQAWIDNTLSSRPANTQAFVFAHKNILGGNHKDNLFGGNIVPTDPAAGKDPGDGNGMDTTKFTPAELAALNAKQDAENKFVASMQANKVAYVITGHDHHHYASLVTSPDGKSQAYQLILASDSSKFYLPTNPVSANDTPIQQDLGRIGYYIVTVDGPLVTIDYYADSSGGADYGLNGGTFDFVKVSTITRSMNGTDKIVAQGASYEMTDNTNLAATLEKHFMGTTMAILAGTNGAGTNPDLAVTNYGKKMSNDVTTSWSVAEPGLVSDILRLGGMSRSLGSKKTDEYVLAMSYAASNRGGQAQQIQHGAFGILTRDSKGAWVQAVTKDFGVTQNFVVGAWNSSYKLGTCGVDPDTKTAWAVLNYNGDFAVGSAPKTF